MDAEWTVPVSIGAFGVAALIIGVAGYRLSGLVDRMADRLKLGETLAGGVFAGAATSLSGLLMTVSSALNDFPRLAASNAIGGIAVQTTFIVLADFFYRRANLEHAAASGVNLSYGVLLIILLCFPLLAHYFPDVTLWQIHPATLLMFVFYGAGLDLIRRGRVRPMWIPRRTPKTREEVPSTAAEQSSLRRLWAEFALLAALVGGSGWALARAAESLVLRTGLSETAVGSLFTGITTSLPEAIVAVAAVRQGALNLAVGNIIGGNAFDVLQLALADAFYRGGSLYHALASDQLALLVMTLLMTAVLVLGMLVRSERGIANVGFEGILILAVYFGGMGLLLAT